MCRAARTARTALARSPALEPPQEPDESGAMDIHVLVPALREQPYVPRTVAGFARLAEHYEHVRVWFVTTEREEAEPGDGPTTRTLLERALADQNAPSLAVLHYPHTTGNKASQLNWIVHALGATVAPELTGRTYVGVFDFDSQPDPQTAALVAERAACGAPEVIQVVPLNTGTLNGPPQGRWTRALVAVEALHHGARSLGVERWKLDRGERGHRHAQYVVGAGVFLRLDALRAAGGFPFVDDVPLGYRLFLRGAVFGTVQALNTVDLPETLAAHLSSLKFIARGVLSWPEVLHDSLGTAGVRWPDRVRLGVLGVKDGFEITAYPWLAVALTPRLIRGGRAGRLLAVAVWTLPMVQTAVMRRVLRERLTPEEWFSPALLVAAASLGRRFWRTLGAWRLIAASVAAARSKSPVEYTKRDRVTSVPAAGATTSDAR